MQNSYLEEWYVQRMVIMVKSPQGGRGNNQRRCVGRGNGNKGRGNIKPGKKVVRQYERAQCYAFPSKNEAHAFDTMIRGTIIVYD